MSSTYTLPREPRDRSRTDAAKRRTLERRAARRAKFLAVAL